MRGKIKKRHPYQIAAVALFLALKVEETPRKMKDLIQALCQVAQQNPDYIIDEQSRDYWKWRDNILDNEDLMLELLCFDLDIESSHRRLFEMLKQYNLQNNKRLRNSAWAFVNDAMFTELCLLYDSQTIAAASLLAADIKTDCDTYVAAMSVAVCTANRIAETRGNLAGVRLHAGH